MACTKTQESPSQGSAAGPGPGGGSSEVLPVAPTPAPPPSGDTWIVGSMDERFATVSKHLRGFDVAMVETGQRYVELAWAGKDKNWDYATYQLDKIELAIANGVERRPKRAASVAMLKAPLAAVRDAVKARDAGAFATTFATLTQTCNTCHAIEKVPFIRIAPPTARLSPVVAPAPTK